MSELKVYSEPGDQDKYADAQFGETDLNTKARLELYKLIRPELVGSVVRKVDIIAEEKHDLAIKSHENYLDIGTGAGDNLIELAKNGHMGFLIGVDNHSPTYQINKELAEEHYPNVSYFNWDATDLRLGYHEADVVTIRNALNFMSNWQGAIFEAWRVLKPGGRLGIFNRGRDNLKQYWEDGEILAKVLGKKMPPNFYSFFDIEDAEILLRPMLGKPTISNIKRQHIDIRASKWETYRLALFTHKDSMLDNEGNISPPRTSQIYGAIDGFIKPRFDREIEKAGLYPEIAHHGYLIYHKPAS